MKKVLFVFAMFFLASCGGSNESTPATQDSVALDTNNVNTGGGGVVLEPTDGKQVPVKEEAAEVK